LTNTNDINSTERLLNVIRGAKQPFSSVMDEAEDISPKQKNSDKISVNFPRIFAGKRRFTVGVDIGQNVINYAKMTKTSDGRPLLVNQKIVKFGDKIATESTEFNDLLKTSLTAFAGSLEDCDIWTMMDATEVNVHHLKIPHVPKKQLGNVIYWAAKKENPIDEKEVVFDFEVQGEISDQGIPKHSVMVYTAPRVEVEKVKNIFSSIGINLAGITIRSFAVQNIFRTQWIVAGDSAFASIYIGNDFSRIDIYRKSDLVMTRGIKTGISSMMEAIDESIAETSPDGRADKERVKTILDDLSADPGKLLKDQGDINWKENGILDMITPALERLVRQIERTLEYYATSIGYEKVDKVYISSVMNVFYEPLLKYINEQLGTKSEVFDPFQGKNVSASRVSLPIAERASLLPVIGLALSDRKHTPNVIFTYVQKKQEVSRKIVNRGIFATFAAALAFCLFILAFQATEARHLGIQKEKLEKELSLFNPVVSKDTIAGLAKDMKMRHQLNQQYSQKYKGMALISELSFLTPDNIRLINVRIAVPVTGVQEQKAGTVKKDATQREKDEGVSIQGVVLGNRSALDTLLAQYVLKLENSPMLQGVSLQKSSIVNFRKNEILQFVINAKIG
jgi:type IV pilus assembly protein PilM